ncbi:MAG: hypothetical protein VX738_09125 [Planctomycetota bacterium]|nr:hypothetical protein [Planctomycetota bacterium]
MKTKSILLLFVVSLLVGSLGESVVRAESPFDYLIFPFKKVDADPQADYRVTEKQGPWMVLATSFHGYGAEQLAQSLVLELRRDFKLEAFSHRRSYDFTNRVQGRGVDKFGKPKTMVYSKGHKFDEIAVMIGNFESVQSEDAQELLEKVKTMQPKCLNRTEEEGTSQVYAGLRMLQNKINLNPERHHRGPMGRAFITRNPLIPDEYFTQNALDPFVERLNDGVEYSLLDNPGKYTVQVATFRGKVVYDIEKSYDKNAKVTDALVQAGEDAHQLVVALRKQNIEAYEYHDRNESVVTVGSFDQIGVRQLDGKINLNPRVYAVMNIYKAQRVKLNQSDQFGLRPRTLNGIPFDIQPRPAFVPKRSIGSSFLSRF